MHIRPTHPNPTHPTFKTPPGLMPCGLWRVACQEFQEFAPLDENGYGALLHQQHHRPAVVSETNRDLRSLSEPAGSKI